MRRLLAPLALIAALLPLAAQAGAPKPYTARYEVLRNGEALGEATIRFAALPNGRYDFSTRTRGNSGMAGLLGVSMDERSILRWHDGRPETVAYNLSQKVGWKDKQRSLTVDAAAGRITSTDKGQDIALPYAAGVLDRHAVSIALMQDLAEGRQGELDYTVAERREVQQHRYRTAGATSVRTPMGTLDAVRVERVRDSGGGRSTEFWLSAAHGYVPVKMLQKEPDGESIEMRIVSLQSIVSRES
jgi:hypothetical protein